MGNTVTAVKFRPTRSGTRRALSEAEALRLWLAGLKTQLAHEPADQFQARGDAPTVQLGMNASIAVGTVGLLKCFPDECLQFLAPLGRSGFRTGSPVVVAGFGHAEPTAHELNAVRSSRISSMNSYLLATGILREVRCGFFQKGDFHLKLTVPPFELLQARPLTHRQFRIWGRSCCFWCFFTQPRSVSGFNSILASALTVMTGETYDDLDDGTDTLTGYRSVLHGPNPRLVPYDTWPEELEGLAATLHTWRDELSADANGAPRDPRGLIAISVAERDKVNEVMYYLATKAGLTCAELTKDGPKGDGEIHVGTMHRFKGLEYQRLAIVATSDGILPRTALIDHYRDDDPPRYRRELRKARSLLFVATTRARDALTISWHGAPSPFLPQRTPPHPPR